MAHMSRLAVCSLPTGSGPRKSREKRAQMAKDPSSLLQTVSKGVKNAEKAPIIPKYYLLMGYHLCHPVAWAEYAQIETKWMSQPDWGPLVPKWDN